MKQNIATIGSHLKKVTRLAVIAGIQARELQKAVRRDLVIEAMKASRGNQCRAARLIGCHRNTLTRMLDEFDLPSSIGKSPQSAPEQQKTAVVA